VNDSKRNHQSDMASSDTPLKKDAVLKQEKFSLFDLSEKLSSSEYLRWFFIVCLPVLVLSGIRWIWWIPMCGGTWPWANTT